MSREPRLRRKVIAIQGFGRLGSTAQLILEACGVGGFVINDGQRFEEENLDSLLATTDQIGVEKVHRLESRQRNTAVKYERLCRPTQHRLVSKAVQRCDLILCTSNTLDSRAASFRYALRDQKPFVSAGVSTIEEGRRGTVFSWIPGEQDLACQACLLPKRRQEDSSALDYKLIATTASIAADVAVGILNDTLSEGNKRNLIVLDLASYSMEALRVIKRPDCDVCGAGSRERRA